MKQAETNIQSSWQPYKPEHQTDLTLIVNDLHLPPGGVFVPDPGLYEDLQMPTRVIKGAEKIGGAVVKFTVEVPEQILDQNPALFVHGYCGPQEAYDKLRNATARNGKIALTYETPRVQQKFASIHPKHLGKPVRLLSQAPWAVMRSSMQMEDEIGADLTENKFDLSGHSMGGRSATRAALRHPEHVRSVILNESPGLEPQNTLMMIKRLQGFAAKELKESGDVELLFHSVLHILRNPIKIGAEGIAVSNCDIREDVKHLGRMGIKSAAIFGLEDSLISAGKSIRHSNQVADIISFYPESEAHHLWPQTNPFEVAMAHKQLLEKLLDTQPAESLIAA